MRPNILFTDFVSRCHHGEPAIIYGDGQQTREFTNVKDVVDANRTLLTTDATDVEILNIGSGGRITIEELATVIRDEINPDPDIIYNGPREGDI